MIEWRAPGEKGYAAYWRQEWGEAAPEVKRLRNGEVGGRSIIAVMNVYGAHMNNTSGRSQLGQRSLAALSGTSERVVRRVQEWAERHGWLSVLASAVPGKVGKTVVLTIGSVSASGGDVSASSGNEGQPASEDDVAASSEHMAASSGRRTLSTELSIPNSHHPDAANAPCFFCDGGGCGDCMPDRCWDHGGVWLATECQACVAKARKAEAEAKQPEFKREQWRKDDLEQNEGLDEYGEPLDHSVKGGYVSRRNRY